MVFLVDDYHNIHTIKVPNTTTTSQAAHMASVLVDVQLKIQSIPVNADTHREVKVSTKTAVKMCRGGICSNTVNNLLEEFLLHHYDKTFLESLPNEFKKLDMKSASKCLKEMR